MNLADPGTLKAFLRKQGLDAEKSLGQHFLVSEAAVSSIVGAAQSCSGVLEIGPGPGVLTGPLTAQADQVVALELDTRFVRALPQSAPKAKVVHGDALETDLAALLEELPKPRAIVSNMPYYITGPLLQKFAEVRGHFDMAILMMQREVATRISAPVEHRDRGSLSVYLQFLFDIKQVCHVPAGAFMPPPKVESTVLKFVPRETGMNEEEQEKTFRIVRLAFAQPRKTLANNLAAGLHRDRSEMVEVLESIGMWEKTRPQELTADQWRMLAASL